MSEHLGAIFDDVGSRVVFFVSSFDMLATRERTKGARWRHDGPKARYDSAKMGHDSAKINILSSTWELLGHFIFKNFRRSAGKRKTLTKMTYFS